MSFLEPETSAIDPLPPASEAHEAVLELLSPTPIGADELIRESGLDAPTLSVLLLDLALAGRITRHANGAISLA
jgi:DNA processing protein